MTTVTQTPP